MAAGHSSSLDAARDWIGVEHRDGGVVVLRIDRPKMNALSVALLDALRDTAVGLGSEPPGAVVLWGGPRIFAAGADVSELARPGAAARVGAAFLAATGQLASLPCPTVAAVNGYALGGGLELALACDLRVVADDARLGQPEVLLGIIPGGGATQRLPRLVGVSRAKDLVYTGRQVGAEEALRIGLADRVVGRAEVLDEAVAWATALASGPALALRAAKRVIDEGIELPLAHALALEASAFVEVAGTEDAKAGVASFLEHGPGRARFAGR